MKSYQITYITLDKTQWSICVPERHIAQTVVELLEKHCKIIGIEIC